MIRSYTADFETTTNEEDCRVWAWGVSEIDNTENTITGTTLDEFMEWCEKHPDGNPKIYFHNLKFDIQFVLYWLLKHDFKHIIKTSERATKTFQTLISDKGLYYCIEVIFFRKGKRVKKVAFYDSYKLIPLSVEAIAETFKLPFKKLKIDYAAHNNLPEGSPISKEEEEYLKHDVKIVATALEYFLDQGLDRMTIGSNALYDYKKILTKEKFKMYFPTPEYHRDVKPSYKGGYTNVNKKYAGKNVKEGAVFDINSLYSWVMKTQLLPWGTPIFFEGEYKEDKLYPLYIQMITCSFELKEGKLPTIQIKDSLDFRGNEYLTSSEGDELTLCLNSVDLALFKDHYHVRNITYHSGWKFKGTRGLFDEYIDKWTEIKIQAKKQKNYGLYLIAKLMLNALYGKFGTDVRVKSKIPYLDEEADEVKFKNVEMEDKDGVYIPMASFITSYARLKTISASQKICDNYENGVSKAEWIYSDTDSLHVVLNGEDVETFIKSCGLEISDTKLGAWKFESKFTKGKFLRSKCYIEMSTEDVKNPNPEYKLKVTVAGMPKECWDQVTFRNFKPGATYKGKLQPKIVKGGMILTSVDFTIKM